MTPPTNRSTSSPVSVIRRASAVARWSIQTMTLRSESPDMPTVRGFPGGSSATSEQVASKPTPFTAEGGISAILRAARTARAQAFQMSEEDCSTMSPASCQTVIGLLAVASRTPHASKTPARACAVPTSMPIKTCRLSSSFTPRSHLPAGVAAIGEDDAAGHQARLVGGQEQDDRRDLRHLAEPAHRGAADPGIVHRRLGFDEGIERRRNVGLRHSVDAHDAHSPLGGERFGEVMHRRLRGIVVPLLLRLLADD